MLLGQLDVHLSSKLLPAIKCDLWSALKVMRTMDFIQWNRVWESRIDASESWIASERVWKRCNLLLCEQFRKITASLMDKLSKIIKWKAWNIQKFWIRNSDSEWLLIWLLKRIAGRLSNEESPIEGYHIKVAAHIEQCSALCEIGWRISTL